MKRRGMDPSQRTKGQIKAMLRKNERIGIIIFSSPALILFGIFFLFPVFSVFVTGFTKWNGMSKPLWAGFNNYKLLFSDPVFTGSVKNNILWAFSAAFIQVPLAAVAAIILAAKPRFWKLLRTVYFLPQVISGIALAMLWSSIYNSEYGLLNKVLEGLGLGRFSRNWLGDLNTAFPAVLIYWLLYIGYYMVIILADIKTIPASYYEAAGIDGASGLSCALHVTLPLIFPSSLCTCVTLALVYGLRQFEQVFILTGGGPANRTSVLVIYLYQQMKNNAYGLSSAAGVALIAIGIAVITLTRKLFAAGEK
jgi:raffinose/stachyose/melibiose transport system permease protein